VAVAFLTLFAVAMGVQSWRVAREARRAERNALRAEREAEAARQVRDFLIDMFEGADPRRSKGSPVTARQLLDMGAERIERELADQPVLKSRLTESLGNLYFKLGEYDLAEHFFTETLGLQEVHLEHIDASVAMSLLNLANVQLSRGDTGAARPLLERALTIARDSLGPDHSDTARILAALGVMEYIEDNHEESARLLGSAVDVYERTQGPDDPVVAKLLNNLARVLTVLGRYAEAEAALERALSIQRGRDEVDQSQVAQLNASLGRCSRIRDASTRPRSATGAPSRFDRRSSVQSTPTLPTPCASWAQSGSAEVISARPRTCCSAPSPPPRPGSAASTNSSPRSWCPQPGWSASAATSTGPRSTCTGQCGFSSRSRVPRAPTWRLL